MLGRKSSMFIGALILVIMSSIITFTVTSAVRVRMDNRILISREDYNNLVELSKILTVRDILEENFVEEVDRDKLYTGALKGMVWSLDDPYAMYYTEEEYRSLRDEAEGKYSGVGLSVIIDREDKMITVINSFKEGPAYRAGILPGDKIVKVEGEDVTGISTMDEFNRVVNLLKGPEGVEVLITVYRENDNKEFMEFTVKREVIQAQYVNTQIINEKIGYIRVQTFNSYTVDEEFEQKLEELLSADVQGLIVDVRDNLGGMLDKCVDITNHLVPQGLIVSIIDRHGNERKYNADRNWVDMPIVVLINGNTSSGAEILAGGVRDRKTGILIGTRTYGKGLVQSVVPLEDNSALKYTESKYYTPGGVSIHEVGIEPDIKVELPEQYRSSLLVPEEEDTQLQKAISVLTEMIEKE